MRMCYIHNILYALKSLIDNPAEIGKFASAQSALFLQSNNSLSLSPKNCLITAPAIIALKPTSWKS